MLRTISGFMSRLSQRFVISALVIAAIAVSISVVATGIYVSFSATMIRHGHDRQEANLRIAATIFASAIHKLAARW
ncbi:MAG: hypothetical protein ABS75_10045 [Pelagibacterium sp. SCN 63-23]|nr:MAG: hypothetical protein ABS75_10045 [Pelagibacterium sp. SCN 63-23]